MGYQGRMFAELALLGLAAASCQASIARGDNQDAGVGGSAPTSGGGPSTGGSAAGADGGSVAGKGRRGSAGDGGAREAGADDAAIDAQPPSGCAGRSYAFCEDFESAADGKLPAGWTQVAGWSKGEAVVTSSEHHAGQRALASAVAANGQPRAGHSLVSLGATAGTHWGRIFYKVKTPFPLPPTLDKPVQYVIHNTLVGLRGSSESRVVDTVVNSSKSHQFLYNLPDDSCCSGSAYDYHSYDGNWHCAEWYIDAKTQSFRFFFDGVEVKSIGFQNWPSGAARIEQFSSIVVGWINYQTPAPPYSEAWFDDLVIDVARVGCN
jgi:hypothetical protein